MKHNKCKRYLILFLILSLMMTMMPSTALALDETIADTAEELIQAVDAGGTVKLDSDIVLSDTLTINEGVTATIDLNGHTLTSGAVTAIDVTGEGTKLVICDSSGQDGMIIAEYDSSMTKALWIKSGASAVLQSGTIKVGNPEAEQDIYCASNAAFTMTGGRIESGNSSWINTIGTGNVSFEGGRIYAPGANSINSRYYDKAANAVVREKDGAFTVVDKDKAPEDFNVNYGNSYYDCFGTISNATSAIYNTYKNSDEIAQVTVRKNGSGNVPAIILSQGQIIEFILEEGASIGTDGNKAIKIKDGAKVVVSGEGTVAEGTFITEDELKLVSVTDNGVTTYEPVIPDYFSTDGKKYQDLQEAITDTESGHITVLHTAVQSEAISVPEGKNIFLDLGGYSLTLNGSTNVQDSLSGSDFTAAMVNKGKLTVGNGEITTANGTMNTIVNFGELTVEPDGKITNHYQRLVGTDLMINLGGTVRSEGELYSASNNIIATYGGTVEIAGGKIETTARSATGIAIFNRAYDSEKAGGDAEVKISGGELKAGMYVASVNNIRSGASNLTITGGTLASYYTAVYWPAAGTLTIGTEGSPQGPVISSENGSSIEICSGTLNVYGGELEGGTMMTGSDAYETDQELVDAFRNNSGSANMGDAITVVTRRGAGYADDPVNVYIGGGYFDSLVNYGVRYLDCNLSTSGDKLQQPVSMKIDAGNFSGGLGAVNAAFIQDQEQGFIYGGSYSTAPAEENISGDLIVKVNEDGTFTVTHAHQFDTDWSYDEESHWHSCRFCDARSDEGDHELKWIIDREATDKEPGAKHQECIVCGYETAVTEIPATGTADPGTGNDEDLPNGQEDEPKDDVPKTEDGLDLNIWICIMVSMAIGIAGMRYGARKQK